MDRGKRLSEVATVHALDEEGLRSAEIARRVKRSRNAVVNVLKTKKSQKSMKKLGRPRKISPKVVRSMARKARTGEYTASQLRSMYGLDVNLCRVQQLLSTDRRLE